MTRFSAGIAAACLCFASAPAIAHPHIFAEARLEIDTTADGKVSELRHVWRFDEIFSSSVLLDFDTDGDLQLSPEELGKISDVVTRSLAEFDYYTSLSLDGKDVGVTLPEPIKVAFSDGQLLMFFAVKADQDLPLAGKLSVGVFDPTMYAAIDFLNDEDMVVTGPASSACGRSVVRPDPDEVIAQNQGSLTDAFFEDPSANDLSKLFATRIELTCS